MEWSGEMLSTCKRMWEGGFRREVIADSLGVTPNAISGKVHRKGWERKKSVIERDTIDGKAPKEALEAPPRPATAIAIITPQEILRRAVARAKAVKIPVPPPVKKTVEITTRNWVTKANDPSLDDVESPNAKTLAFRKPNECAFPVGQPDRPANQDYCCNRVENGRNYCGGHVKIMFPPHAQIKRGISGMRARGLASG